MIITLFRLSKNIAVHAENVAGGISENGDCDWMLFAGASLI